MPRPRRTRFWAVKSKSVERFRCIWRNGPPAPQRETRATVTDEGVTKVALHERRAQGITRSRADSCSSLAWESPGRGVVGVIVSAVQSRRLGKTGHEVSEIGFGAWAVGGDWGQTDDRVSLAAMGAAVEAGVTFFDTADVYGDGHSERLIARLLRDRSEPLFVATKFGRRAPQEVVQYSYQNLRSWLERSRENLGVDT